jgi:hypothetical protein
MKRTVFLFAAMMAMLVGFPVYGQKIDQGKFTQELQRTKNDKDSFQMVWWIPTEFWQASFENVPSMTEEQKDKFYETVNPYIVICVADVKTTMFGNFLPCPKEEILSHLSVKVNGGKALKPLQESEISGDAKNLFAMMKPVLANGLGQFGKGMEFVCFDGLDADGNRLLDPKGDGKLTVKLNDSVYKWRLPLGSLLPPKYDSQTGDEFPGNFLYSPFTGAKLTECPEIVPADSPKKKHEK